MDKLMFGKLLGEIYRIQNHQGNCYVDESVIYGLLHGFESTINEEIESIGYTSIEEVRAVMDILDEYHKDNDKLSGLKGYYDIEHKLKQVGIERYKAVEILTYLKANRQYEHVIEKFNSSNSPVECKTFELNEWDK